MRTTFVHEVIVKFEGYDPVENNRYIILSTEQLLNKLRDYPQWGADGTFFDVTLYNITDGALEGILKSVERTYYGQIEDEIRSILRYPPEKWNLYERVKNSEPRSSNGIEAYNNQLVRKAVEARPNIWHWIRIIKVEIALSELKIDEFQAGQPKRRRRSNYRIMDDRLRETVLRYDKMPLEDFIRNIANHLRLDTVY